MYIHWDTVTCIVEWSGKYPSLDQCEAAIHTYCILYMYMFSSYKRYIHVCTRTLARSKHHLMLFLACTCTVYRVPFKGRSTVRKDFADLIFVNQQTFHAILMFVSINFCGSCLISENCEMSLKEVKVQLIIGMSSKCTNNTMKTGLLIFCACDHMPLICTAE